MAPEIKTGRIIFDALEATINLLSDLNIKYALIGGIALAVWGRERATKDIDIIISVEEDRLRNLIDLLEKRPFSIKSSLKRLGDSLLIFAIYEDKETGFPVDVDLFIAQTEFQREALRRSKEIEVLGKKLNVVSAEDLLLYKLLADRPIDFIDAQTLLEKNKREIDKNYLGNWAKRLGIQRRLQKLYKSKDA